MLTVNDHINAAALRIEQLKNQKKAQERREKSAKRKIDTRRYIIVGGLVCNYFPDVMKYQPQRTAADTAKEFEHFENILRTLSSDEGLLARLKDETARLT